MKTMKRHQTSTERSNQPSAERGKNNKNIQPAGECHMNRAAKTMLSLLQVLGTTCKHPHKQHGCLPSNTIKCAVKWIRLIGRGGTSLPSYCSRQQTKCFSVFVNLFAFLVLDVVMWPIYIRQGVRWSCQIVFIVAQKKVRKRDTTNDV